MTLNANALTSLNTLKSYLNIELSNTSEDSRLELFINAASQKIEIYCCRSFKTQTIIEYHDGKNNDRLLLKQFPASKPSAIYSDTAWNYSASTLLSADIYDVVNEQILVLKSGNYFPKGNKNIKIIYDAGYANIPSDLELACIKLVDYYYSQNSDRREGIKSKSKNGENISFIDGMPTTIVELIEPYRKMITDDSQWGYNL